jgi:SAM-dependent methyltransferase
MLSRLIPIQLYNYAVSLEATISKTRVKACYLSDMKEEFGSIKAFLPQKCRSLLDIGCGIGGIDLFLYRHYKYSDPMQVYLLDKTRIEPQVYYLFEPKGAFYNSLEIAKEMLVGNGVDSQHIHLIEANDNNTIDVVQSFELVISLISWGFHYPVSTYLHHVYQALADEGVLILDVRKGTSGEAELRDKFSNIKVAVEREKYKRLVAIKK